MSRAKRSTKSQATRKKPAVAMLPERELRKLEVVEIRLHRATDVLTCLDYLATHGAEVNVGALALACRDLIDRVLDDLAPFGRGLKTLEDES